MTNVTIWTSPAVFLRSCVVLILQCMYFVRGLYVNMQVSPLLKNLTHSIVVTWQQAKKVCPLRSTWRLTAAMTLITRV